ncbi:MAG TPA: UvrD-helicase domain-containing protein [Streptosporangiaceae bacterium]
MTTSQVQYSPAQLARILGAQAPTAEQAAVIGAPLAPMAVIAGAGSGKSETMAARLVWLVANQLVRPERVLGLTFTRKAAAELADRVRVRLSGLRRAGLALPGTGVVLGAGPAILSSPALSSGGLSGGMLSGTGGLSGGGLLDDEDLLSGDPVISTYHAYAGRLVGDHALREGLEPTLRLITPAVSWQLAARVVAAYDGPTDALEWTPATVTAATLALAGEMAEHLRGPDDVLATGGWLESCVAALTGKLPKAVTDVLKHQRTREQLLPLVAAYSAAKAVREVIDYGDQMALAARIASRHPVVGLGERARYQVVLLDEYQDTSHAQLVLLRSLFGGGHPVTAVGDPCQSIYGWRGASAGNLRRFSRDFAHADSEPAPVRVLSTSFRNTGRVLLAAGAIQAELRAAAPDVPLLVAPSGRADRGVVRCALLESVHDEAAWVADEVAGFLQLAPGLAPDGMPWPDGGDAKVKPSDIAVLCRKRAQFAALRAALEARDVPVEVVGLGGLLTVPEVADIVATLQVMHDPAASGALVRLLTSPRWRIGPADLVALGRRARSLASATSHEATDPTGGHRAGKGQPGTGQPATRQPGASRPGSAGTEPRDLISGAVTDLTRDTGSLVEALDDLGTPAAYSFAGHARMTALAAELRVLRGHVARPLAELVMEVERMLGLDIEVASRPGTDPATARADLDAFADAAAAFAGDAQEPTLGAFLAYLEAAESEEFGLEAGRVGETDSVKLATVHAAKGLQWAAVFVPGLAGGAQRHVFPAKPRVTTRWTENARLLPFSLRGDAADLPPLQGLTSAELTAFGAACTARDVAEERRLGYVAATRAAYMLGCSGYWWSDGVSRLGPSRFLAEVRAACEDGAGQVAHWHPEPVADAVNPALAEPPTAVWPAAAAAGARYAAIRAAGALVEEAARALRADSDPARADPAGSTLAKPDLADPDPDPDPDPDADAGPDAAKAPAEPSRSEPDLVDLHAEVIAAWARDTDLLLAERTRRQTGPDVLVSLPRQLPVSSLVTMARDPAELAQQVRRPMPRRPVPQAARGTTFHLWVEQRFGQAQLIDANELPGAADDLDAKAGDPELAELKARFEAGEWASRWPAEVEVPFETKIGDRLIRGRIDAVFADADQGGFDVVDWKTGRQPASAAEKRAVAVQLAAYRLAWAALASVPLTDVRAAFYYVRDDVTIRPADLLDKAGLAALIEDVELAAPHARVAAPPAGDGA